MSAATTQTIADRIEDLDWPALTARMEEEGFVQTSPVLSASMACFLISLRRFERCCFSVMRYASDTGLVANAATAFTSVSCACVGCQSQRGLPASAVSSRMALIATCICS